MELRQLEYFAAIADEGGFGRAAERSHVVASAVSQQIARLERELGVRLFDRTTRQVRLTPDGERLLKRARAVLAGVEAMRREARELAAGTQKLLRLGTSRSFADAVYAALDVLAERRPDVRVEPRQLARRLRLDAVRAGEIDAALVRGGASDCDGELIAEAVWSSPLYAAVPVAVRTGGGGAGVASVARSLTAADLAGLAALPIRLAPRSANPAFHDLVSGIFHDAALTLIPGPPFTTLQATLAAIAADADAGSPSWTLFDTDDLPAVGRRVVLRRLDGHTSVTYLVFRRRSTEIDDLLAALRPGSSDTLSACRRRSL